MINKALFKLEWRSNYKILLIFCAILTMYITIMVSMYDPKLGTALQEFSNAMPDLMAMVGMSGNSATLIDFLSTYLYGLIMIVFPLIFIIILALRLIIKKVDNGVMAYLLSSGVKRSSICSTQLLVLITNLFTLILYATIIAIITSQIMFPDKLEISQFINLNLGLFILQLAFSSIVFLASCFFNEYRYGAIVGSGIPIMFVLINMLANMKGSMDILKYATIISLFDIPNIMIKSSDAYLKLGVLGIISIICWIISIVIFNKKNMSL